MAKGKISLPSIYTLSEYLKEDNLLPVYFFCGEDIFTIDNAVESVQKVVEPLLGSDFDRETISADKNQNITDVLDLASQFPFGGRKKLIVLKNFERINDKKSIAGYVKDPPEFTIFVITQNGNIADTKKEPYVSLIKRKFIFEARKLKGTELVQWLMRLAKKQGVKIDSDVAQALIDIVGEDKSLLEMQIQKLFDYLGRDKKVTFDLIKKMVAATKEYSIFDLQDALGKGDKAKSVEIVFNLMESGKEPVYIFTMLSRFITTIAQSLELSRMNMSDYDAAKKAGVSYYYYINCKKTNYFLNERRLLNASRALYEGDLTLKTSSIEAKTLLSIVIGRMLENDKNI
ncbi:DNA polymerase III subunit delta [Bacteroidota bacterium]